VKVKPVLLMLLLVVVLLPVQTASGETIFIYTSTADFDSGNKGDPGTNYGVDNGIDQPTYQHSSVPPAIYDSATQRTYIVWQGTSNWLPHIIYYDHTTSLWATEVAVASSNPDAGDGHGAPAMAIDADGYIYVFYGSHSTSQKAVRSTFPNSISSWTALADPDATATYPNLIVYNGFLYFFYRDGGAFGGPQVWRKSGDQGTTWTAQADMILPDGLNGQYLGGWTQEGTKVYWAWTRFVDGVGLRNIYACYFDLSTETLFGLDGTSLGVAISTTEAENSCKGYSSTEATGQPKAHVKNGNLYMTFNEGTDAGANHNIKVKFVSYVSGAWTIPVELVTVDNGVDRSDFVVNSATDIEALITTSGLNHGCLDDCEYSGDIERWTWDGTTWTQRSTIMSETESGEPVNFPFAVLNGIPEMKFVFTEFGSDVAGSDAKTRLKIYGWGTNGFVYNTAVGSGNWGVESTTDSSDVASGGVRLTNRQRDEFTTTKTRPDTFKWHFQRYGDGTAECTTSIADGVLTFTWDESGAGTGRRACQINSRSQMTGDFDIRMKFVVTDLQDNGVGIFGICGLDNPDICSYVNGVPFTTTDGLGISCFAEVNGLLKTWKAVSGVWTQVGTENAVCNPTGFWLRITRAGNVFTSYYSTNGLEWTQDEQVTLAAVATGTWPHALLDTNAVTSGAYTVTLDSFLEANNVMTTPYRTSGSWTTPSISATGKVKEISLTFSGVSATEYIDFVEVLNSAGTVLFVDSTNLISGTSKIVPVTLSTSPTVFTVRVTLAGTGAASPTLESVQVILKSVVTGGEDLPSSDLQDRVAKAIVIGAAFAGTMLLFSRRRRRDRTGRR